MAAQPNENLSTCGLARSSENPTFLYGKNPELMLYNGAD
jgi:hypothetical protein